MKETLFNTKVTYTLEHQGKFYIIEYVPAHVCRETGEEYFSPETVENIQSLIKNHKKTKLKLTGKARNKIMVFVKTKSKK